MQFSPPTINGDGVSASGGGGDIDDDDDDKEQRAKSKEQSKLASQPTQPKPNQTMDQTMNKAMTMSQP